MKRPLWFRGGILIGLLAVPLALYAAAEGENTITQVVLLGMLGLLALATVVSGK